jgi:hypothetical protein
MFSNGLKNIFSNGISRDWRFTMRICGKASEVFKTITNICQRSPDMTLKEAGESGLLSPNLQNTTPFEIGKCPYVYLNEGYDKN